MFIIFFPKDRVIYEIMWKNTVEPDNIIRRMRIACRITKTIQTHIKNM